MWLSKQSCDYSKLKFDLMMIPFKVFKIGQKTTYKAETQEQIDLPDNNFAFRYLSWSTYIPHYHCWPLSHIFVLHR